MCKNIEAPQIAKDHGMTCLVFEDDFDSYDTIDVNNTGEKGYNWYVERPYNFTTIEAGVDYKVENSVLTMCNRNPLYNYGMGTYHPSKKIGWWFCKGVLEFRIRIPNPDIPEGNGARIIELTEGSRTIKTWIRIKDGKVINEVNYPADAQ
jgi:hypothetical protein